MDGSNRKYVGPGDRPYFQALWGHHTAWAERRETRPVLASFHCLHIIETQSYRKSRSSVGGKTSS